MAQQAAEAEKQRKQEELARQLVQKQAEEAAKKFKLEQEKQQAMLMQ